MTYPNGQFPASALAPIAGGGFLAKEDYRNPSAAGPAAAWNAMAAWGLKNHGVHIQVTGPDSSYRNLARQIYYRNLYLSGQGNLAAIPGTSNHGMGINVDVPAWVRTFIDNYGAQFGWSKSWSDAPSEWWHITYQTGHYNGADPGGTTNPTPTLKKGDKGAAVKQAQTFLHRWNVGVTRPKPDGSFGENTADAVREFQLIHDLHVDGVIGDGTWKQLRQKDKLYGDERLHVNRLRLLTSGDNITAKERDQIRGHREWAAKRAASIKKVAEGGAGWNGQNRDFRFKTLKAVADDRY